MKISDDEYLNAIAQEAILNGFISDTDLAPIMAAEDNCPDIMLPLLKVFGFSIPKEGELETEQFLYRVGRWAIMIGSWESPDSPLGRPLNLYYEVPGTGELMRCTRESWLLESYLIKLEELKDYIKDIERVCKIIFPLPKRLFPVNGIDTVSNKEPDSENTFRLEGDFWTISYEGILIRLKNAKGLHYIAYLLKNPNRDIKGSELVRIMEPPYEDLRAKDLNKMGEPYLEKESLRKTSALGDSGNALDSKAIAEYKKRLKEIKEELSEEVLSDEDRFTLREEKEGIEDELKAGFDRLGRPRKLGDVEEKIRKAVTNRIKESLKTINKEHPALGKHLSDTLKTGATCSYTPTTDISWNT